MKSHFENFRSFLKEFQLDRPTKTPELRFDPETKKYISDAPRTGIQYDPQVQGYRVTKEQLDQINNAIKRIYHGFTKAHPEYKDSDGLNAAPQFDPKNLKENPPAEKKLNEQEIESEIPNWEELDPEQQQAIESELEKFPEDNWEELSDENKIWILKRLNFYTPEDKLQQPIRKVSDAPKGIGQMTTPEWESSGYIIPVSEGVLRSFEEMVGELKGETVDDKKLYDQAKNWYHDIRELLDTETDNDQDATFLGMLIATFSPRAKFSLNLVEAAFVYKAVKEDKDTNPEGLRNYLEALRTTAGFEAGEPRGFTKAHKVPNFALNLIAPELAGEEKHEWNSTIDTWMIDAFYPEIKEVSTSKEWAGAKGKMMSSVSFYRYMAGLVAKETKALGLDYPHELQAIVWVASQVRSAGRRSAGVTTDFAFNQIKAAILNQAGKGQVSSEDAPAAFEKAFGGRSWLGVIFKMIDRDYGEASKIVLGTKDEKGKVVNPGVRSLSSRGKKGDAYSYYPARPAPPKEKKPKVKGVAVPKEREEWTKEEYSNLKTYHALNKVVQMMTGKFNNLYDAITLYLKDATKQDAVDYILGRFDPEAKKEKDYFNESKKRIKIRILKS